MNIKELENKWNSYADKFNQWSELGLDEIVAFAQKVEREECAMECRNVIVGNENGHYDQITAEECGYQILMRSNVKLRGSPASGRVPLERRVGRKDT